MLQHIISSILFDLKEAFDIKDKSVMILNEKILKWTIQIDSRSD